MRLIRLLPALVLVFASTLAVAADKVRLVDTQAQIYVDFALYIAEQEGYYKAENIDASILVGRGGAASLQTVATGTQDIVYGPGVLSVIAAYAKGAPVKIIANAVYGARDLFWLARTDGPIKSFKDLDGKTFSYAAPGSLTHLVAQAIADEFKVKPKFIQTGTLTATRTQMMTGQIDTAWAGFPAGISLVRSGEARIIGSGYDSPMLRQMTTRVTVANSDWLKNNRDVATRAMRAIWKGQQFAFSNPEAQTRFAKHWDLDVEDSKRAWEFIRLEDAAYAPIGDLDGILRLAQEYDFIKEPLTEAQKKDMIDILYDPKR
jgi:NitT/TauT family transport system substrate-binding protein